MFRLLAPTLAISLFVLTLGVAAAWYLHRSQQKSSVVLSTNISKLRAAEELVVITHDIQSELSLFLATGDTAHLQTAADHNGKSTDWTARCSELAQSDDELRLVKQFKQGYGELEQSLVVLRKLPADSGRLRPAVERASRLANEKILNPVLKYRVQLGKEREEAARDGEVAADGMAKGLLALGVCASIAGLVAGFGLARNIRRSIIELSVPIHDTAGKLHGLVGPIEVSGDRLDDLQTTMNTVSAQVGRVVSNLRESQEVARRARQLAAMGQLAAGMAHELRNPLTSMKIIVQSAAESPSDAGLNQQELNILQEEITRLERTIQSFLDFARPPKIVQCPMCVQAELQWAIALIAPRSNAMGVQIELDAPAADVMIEADSVQLRQVFLNLLNNALDVVPEQSTIHVRLDREAGVDGDGRAAESRPGVRIEFEDSGPGLPPELRQTVFEPFVTSRESGIGLGLAICRRIIHDHGGRITAEDGADGGAVFTVTLPVRNATLRSNAPQQVIHSPE